MSRFLIMLEQIETGFAVQVPDLAITTYGESIEAVRRAATEAIQINLEAYHPSAAIWRTLIFGICYSHTSSCRFLWEE